MRWLKRWWARVTHRHEWVVIYRSNHHYEEAVVRCGIQITPWQKRKDPLILERCTCGCERARRWRNGWKHVDLDWLNDRLVRQDIDIPARHQE